MKTNLKVICFTVFLFCQIQIAFSQPATVKLVVEGAGTNTICKGSSIQIKAEVTPLSSTYTYQWRLRSGKVQSGSNFWSSTGDVHTGSFFRFDVNELLLESSEIEVSVFGGPMGASGTSNPFKINVITPPNPGTQGDLLLCNKTGTIDLFTLLQGSPDTGGTWSPTTSRGGSIFTVGVDAVGTYTYTIPGTLPCGDAQSSVTIRECFNTDYDNDGVPNDLDLDDDNDGILDSVENSACNSTPNSRTEALPLVDYNFGTGDLPTTDPNVLNHTFVTGEVGDGNYAVGSSNYFLNNATNFPLYWLASDLNPITNADGDGNPNGRYLAINVAGGLVDKPIYQIKDIPVVKGEEYNFRIDIAGLCNDSGGRQCAHAPILQLEVRDQTLPASAPPIIKESSASLGIINDDLWKTVKTSFIASSTTFLTLSIINQQPLGSDGNDLGIDTVRFASLECDFDRDQIPNEIDLDSDNDGIFDFLEAGGNPALDTDNNGIIDGTVDPTTGIPLAVGSGITPSSNNYLDIDSDNDGIPDNIEAQSTIAYIPPSSNDTNNNGVDDSYEGAGAITPIDTDGDSTPDYIDTNSDNDCLNDTIEAYDLNQDGIVDKVITSVDVDGDGLDDGFDTIILGLLTAISNSTNGGMTPSNLPDNHNPGNDIDFREEFLKIDEKKEVSFCLSSTVPIDLFDSLTTLSGAKIPGGIWTGPSALTNGEQGTFTPRTNIAGDYVYTLPTIGSCPIRKGTITVKVTPNPNAGTTPLTPTSICTGDASFNLLPLLGTTAQAGGKWEDPTGNSLGTNDIGTIDPAKAIAGTYTYSVGTPSCNDSATITLAIGTGGNAGIDAIFEVCSNITTPIDLFDKLTGIPDITGTWVDPNGIPFGSGNTALLNPSLTTTLSGDYIYTVSRGTCPIPVTSKVTVTVNTSPTISFPINPTTCAADRASYEVKFTTNGTWDITTVPVVGTINTTTSSITGIPTGTDITIIAQNPANRSCQSSLLVTAPDCTCPSISKPTNPVNKSVCIGFPNPTLSVTILPGQQARWYDNLGKQVASNNINYTPTDTTTGVYIYEVEAFDIVEKCVSDRVPVVLTILDTPIITPIIPVSTCDQYELPPLTIGNYFTQSGGTGTRLNAGDLITVSQSLFIYAETGTTPNCFDEKPLNITIIPTPTPTAPNTVGNRFCKNYILPPLLMGQEYYTGPLKTGSQLTPGHEITESQRIYLIETNAVGCETEVSFNVEILNLKPITLDDDNLCIDGNNLPLFFIDTGLNDPNYIFEWRLDDNIISGITSSTHSVSQAGIYTITYTDTISGCSEIVTKNINELSPPSEIILKLSPNSSFSNSGEIIVTVKGKGDYEYSIDNDEPQKSNVFSQVALGLHEVTAFDTIGCGMISSEIFVMGYSRFFTPNGDGSNDSWNLITESNSPLFKINIYDKYGRLLKQINSKSSGWDGNFGGVPLPATDYWFEAITEINTIAHKGHFTLIR